MGIASQARRGIASWAVLLSVFGPPVQANEWVQTLVVPATLEYDSNPRVLSTNVSGVWRERLAPDYSLTGNFGVNQWQAGAGLRVERSSNSALVLARQDPVLFMGWRRQTATGGFGLRARYEAVSTFASVLEESGVVLTDSTRTTRSLAGDWSTMPTARTTLAANAEYRAVAFDKGSTPKYSLASAGMTYAYAWSANLQPFAQLSASRISSEPASGRTSGTITDSAGLQGGVKFFWNQFESSVQVGRNMVRSTGVTTGWIGSALVRYTGNRFDLTLNAGRTISATAEAGLLSADQIRGSFAYSLGARTRVGTDLSFTESTGGTTVTTTRQVGAWASHELSPFWLARAYLTHTHRVSAGVPAERALLGITLTYSHPDF